MRLIVATHPATSTPHKIGKKRDGVICELFVTKLPAPAFSATDVLDLYLHRGSFETVLADEDEEQETDCWCSRTPWGQEAWQILNQWVWNLRLELSQSLSVTPMRTTEFAPANKPASANKPVYGPPQWARRSFTGGFPGSAFTPQPDGTLLCPAGHPLHSEERRPERDGSLRVLYAARIGDCRPCSLRAACQESLSTCKPRRVSAVYWPLTSQPQSLPPAPMLGPPQPLSRPSLPLGPLPVLWHDWPRCQIRRRWMQVLRSETVMVALETNPLPDQAQIPDEPVITRPQRAHRGLSWQQRLARNARPLTAPHLTLTLHGLPVIFAHLYGFALLEAA